MYNVVTMVDNTVLYNQNFFPRLANHSRVEIK